MTSTSNDNDWDVDHSCLRCKPLVEAIISPEVDESTLHPRGHYNLRPLVLGRLSEVQTASHECTLYRLIYRMWLHTSKPETVSDASRQDGLCSEPNGLTSRDIFVSIDVASTTNINSKGTRTHWQVQVAFVFKDAMGHTCSPDIRWSTNQFCLLVDDVPDSSFAKDCYNAYSLGRLRPLHSSFDRDFLRTCLDTCVDEHGELCRISAWSSTKPTVGNRDSTVSRADQSKLPSAMRVIDVEHEMIIPIPEDCKYTALSYVWGVSNFLKLTQSNEQFLMTKGSLRNMKKPKTIDHAMQVTSVLGLRYLWVDSLCIIQDSPADQAKQIQRMHQIYPEATVTIIAGDSKHADDGLWRQTNTKQIVEQAGGFRFVAMAPSLWELIKESTWSSRAWCYQETVLSRRRLTFANGLAYFECQQSDFIQDYVYSVSSEGKYQLESPKSDESIAAYPHAYLHYFPNQYWYFTKLYTSRQLSFEGDILNATTGVLSAYADACNDYVLCGLRVSMLFELSLLWYPDAKLKRRVAVGREGTQFASWSWAGWIGPVVYEDDDDAKDISQGRIIHEWSLEHSGGILHNKQLDLNQRDEHVARELAAIQTGVLCFKTWSARFRMARDFTSQLQRSEDDRCTSTGLYKIYHNDEWIGMVHLEHDTVAEMVKDDADIHEFILLSMPYNGCWDIEKRTDIIRPLYETDPERENEQSMPPFEPGNDCRDDYARESSYNVMLITRVQELCHRLGIGQVSRNGFDKGSPKLLDIRLG